MYKWIQYLEALVKRGGPQPGDYSDLDAWISRFYVALDTGELPIDAIDRVRRTVADILSPRTMHGFACTKPHGYAGDFEIIERHYLTHIAPEPHLATWDRYWHAGAAACAVRNRKTYFHDLLRHHAGAAQGRRVSVLNIASGPARDVFEFLSSGAHDFHFECIDQDPKAIAHASELCRGFSGQVTFLQSDVLRFRPRQSYDLIWAAGLFDYFSDRVFKLVLRRLLPGLAPGGELVVGNFSTANPNIQWLRFCDWLLYHRTHEELSALAVEAGAHRGHIRIGQEPGGVNLFLHIKRPSDSPECSISGGEKYFGVS